MKSILTIEENIDKFVNCKQKRECKEESALRFNAILLLCVVIMITDISTNLPDVSASVLETDSSEKEKNIVARLTLTKAQKSDLRKAFNLLDFSGEGKIKAEDFRVAIKALGYEPTKEELLSMINAVDKGKTGALSYENFETAIMRKIMSLDSDDNIMKSFHLFDTDNTGFISFENLKKVTEILGVNLTDEEIEEMIEDADKDFDGFISEQEFKKMMKNAVHIATP